MNPRMIIKAKEQKNLVLVADMVPFKKQVMPMKTITITIKLNLIAMKMTFAARSSVCNTVECFFFIMRLI